MWGLLLSVGMSLFFLIPIGILKAVSDTGVGLNVITEYVARLTQICGGFPYPRQADRKYVGQLTQTCAGSATAI